MRVTRDDPTRGSMNETRDCAVLAIANACGVTYATAHHTLSRCGRRNRHGTYWRQLLSALVMLGVRYETPYGVPVSCTGLRIPVNTRQLQRHSGTWIASPCRHFTALVDGEYSDYIEILPRARVLTGAVRTV